MGERDGCLQVCLQPHLHVGPFCDVHDGLVGLGGLVDGLGYAGVHRRRRILKKQIKRHSVRVDPYAFTSHLAN